MSITARKRLVHHLLRAGILVGFALLIVHLVKTDSLTLYIAPRMAFFVKLSSIALYASAVYQLYSAYQAWRGRTSSSCDCDHGPSSSASKNTIIYGLFLLPLALGFMLPNTTLGSSVASKKGVNFASANTLVSTAGQYPANTDVKQTGPLSSADGLVPAKAAVPETVSADNQLDALFPADEYTEANAKYGKQLYKQNEIIVPEKQFIETLTTLDLFRSNFLNKTIEISGFVYREEGMTKDQFAVSRFAMNCCSADALPYGIMITYPRAARYKDDMWIKVRGTLMETEFKGNTIMQLKTNRIQIIEAPESPYVYPDFDFGL